MDSDGLLNNLKVKEEPVDETPESLPKVEVNLEDGIEFCAVQEIKQETFSIEIKPEIVEFDQSQQTLVGDSTVETHTSSLLEYSTICSSEDVKQETKDDGRSIPEQTNFVGYLPADGSYPSLSDVSHFRDGTCDDNSVQNTLSSFVYKQEYKHLENTYLKNNFVKAANSGQDMKIHFCDICKKGFPSRKNIFEHMRVHDDSQKYKCEICDKYLSHKYSLVVHIRRHKGIKNYKCNICAKNFINSCTLRTHLLIHEDKKYECYICKRKFTQKGSVISHMKAVHIDDKTFQCKICNKSFARKYNVELHMFKHRGYSEHQCHICKKYFNQASNLNVHLRSHYKIRRFKCHLCDKSFFENGSLKGHLKIHEGVRHTCNVCGSTFSRSSYLKKHMKIHNGDKQFVCHICNKSFWFVSALKEHMRYHELLYKCNICEKGFPRKKILASHMIIHEGKKFVCPDCGKSYYYKCGLKRHMKTHTSSS